MLKWQNYKHNLYLSALLIKRIYFTISLQIILFQIGDNQLFNNYRFCQDITYNKYQQPSNIICGCYPYSIKYSMFGQNIQKQVTFVSTFCLYVGVHMMRMSYSFNKSNIKNKFQFDAYFLAVLDAFVYISLGVGFFFRFKIIKNSNLTQTLLKTTMLICLFFCVIPIISVLDIGIYQNLGANSLIKIICSISLLMFGFCQLTIWPITFTLVSYYYNPKTQGTILGCWSSNGDIGNIAGFLISSIFMSYSSQNWQGSMIISALFTLIMGLIVRKLVVSKQYKQKLSISQKQLSAEDQIKLQTLSLQIINNQKQQNYENSTFNQFLHFIKNIISNFELILFVVTTSLYKSILYGFLLWCPIFLVSIGENIYSGLIPMIFNISTLLGSLALGKLYQQTQNQTDNERRFCFEMISYLSIKKYKLFLASLILFTSLLLFNYVKSVFLFSVLAFLMGCSLGGIFNMLVANELLMITKGNLKNTDLMSTFTMSLGNTIVGILQLIIAIVLRQFNKDVSLKSQSYSAVFSILVITSLFATVLLLIRITSAKSENVLFKSNQGKNESLKLIQMKQTENLQQKLLN